MDNTPNEPDAGAEKARRKAAADAREFARVIQNADVVDVGVDTEYVPDSPRLRKDHANYDGGEEDDDPRKPARNAREE